MKRPANEARHPSRRRFLAAGAAAASACLLPVRRAVARASDRPVFATIGLRNQGWGITEDALEIADVAALADVDAGVLAATVAKVEKGQGRKPDAYGDYRRVLDRKDIDAVMIATPDHWHTKIAVEAMRAGKDVYCEKPLTLTIDEGKLIRRVQRETGRVVQVGTQQRSTFDLFTKAMALVAEGRLGRIKLVQAAIGGAPTSPAIPVAAPPAGLDWNRWLGPAPVAEYRFLNDPAIVGKEGKEKTNCHYEFRWWYEYSGGKLTDWGAHHVDMAAWALALNGQTDGPLSISGTAKHPVEFKDGQPVERDRYNTATEFLFTVDYPGGTQMVIRHDTDNGVLIEGDKGRIFVSRGKLAGAPVDALKDDPLPEGAVAKVYKNLPMEHNERKGHWANFLHCAKHRKEPISDVHSHMRGLDVCHLAGIAARLGRGLKWDAAAGKIVGDDQADAMLARPYRTGWEIEG